MSFRRHLESFPQDIYAAYCEKNVTEVRLVLDYLRADGLKVYDPALERVPGRRIFDKWLENGIHKSKITLLFWSKAFKQDELCLYQSENAVLRASLTKGRHIVISVVIDNCKIPERYKQFGCVYAWLWRENPPKALQNVLQSVRAQLELARGPSQHPGQRASFLVTKRLGALPCHHGSHRYTNNGVRAIDVLLNVRQIQNALQNCLLCCQNDGCIYRCSGDNIKQFNAHVNSCKFARIMCMNIKCRQTITRGQLVKHKKKCRFKKEKCQNTNCGEELTPKDFKTHKDTCLHRSKSCPNNRFGCKEIFEFKDIENHLEACDYVMVDCDFCRTKIMRMDLTEHKEKRCPHGPATCVHCNNVFKRLKIESHMVQCKIQVSCDNVGCGVRMVQGLLQKHKLNCPWERFRCSNTGCSFTAPKGSLLQHSMVCDYRQQRCDVCGSSVTIKDMTWHKKICDRMVECSDCGIYMPVSSKATHDMWGCPMQGMRVFCRDCGDTFSEGQIEEHRNKYHPVSLLERELYSTSSLPNGQERETDVLSDYDVGATAQINEITEVPDSTQETCEPCPVGQTCTGPTNDATNCATGYYSLSGKTSCTQCPEGSKCPSSSSAPVTCAAVEYAAEGSTFCRQCPAGSECTAGGASACSAGYYSAAGETGCTQCSAGKHCIAGSTTETDCPAGKYSAAGARSCTACSAGYYCTSTADIACDSGTYSLGSTTNCTNLPEDHLEVVEGPPQLHGQRASLVPCDHGLQSCSDNGVSAMNALNYPREMLKCSYPGCTFTAPKDSLLQHSRVCDYRKQRCDICGNNVTIKDMNWHKTVEDQMVECSDCGMFMPPSFKSSHDMWVCPNKQVFYRDCGSTLSEGQIEEHGIQNHTVSRIERELYSTSSLPYGHEREEDVPRDDDVAASAQIDDKSSHDSDTFSTPSSCASWSNTPLHPVEVGAVNWAIDEIQRTITDTQPLQEDEDIPVARQNTPNTPSSLEVCLETNPRETVWNLSLPKITIGSRNLLKKINDAFLLPL